MYLEIKYLLSMKKTTNKILKEKLNDEDNRKKQDLTIL